MLGLPSVEYRFQILVRILDLKRYTYKLNYFEKYLKLIYIVFNFILLFWVNLKNILEEFNFES